MMKMKGSPKYVQDENFKMNFKWIAEIESFSFFTDS